MPQNSGIFQEVQKKYSIREVAEGLGIRLKRVGGSYRADSIDGSGRGENALAIYEASNSWFDFMLNIGGDITDLVAHVQFGGDIKQALHYLMPDVSYTYVDEQIKEKKRFMDSIEHWHNELFSDKEHAKLALEYLHYRRINDDTIKELKIGVKDEFCDGYRIVFPFWDHFKSISYFVSRRYDYGRGENEKSPKYKNASLESYPFLRNSPLGLNSLNRKKNDTLYITEGIFDWLAFYQEGYSVLATHGGDFGKLWKEVIEKIKPFKKVVLVFDNDNAGRDFTYKAAKVLLQHRIPFECAALDTKDVAEHYQVFGNLNAIINSIRPGLSWLTYHIIPNEPFENLSLGEREKAMERCKQFIQDIAPFHKKADVHDIIIALKKYFPKDFTDSLRDANNSGPAQFDIAEAVKSKHSILYNPRTGFFEYQTHDDFYADAGIWKKIDDEVIGGYIMKALGRFATGGKVSSILKLIKNHPNVHSEIPVREFNSLPLLSFKNGTLHIDTNNGKGELKEHSYYDFTTVRLPYKYDPNAVCPNWEKFIAEITNNQIEAQRVLQEFAGYILLPHCKFQQALMLKGGGSNGKSVFFNIISALFGGSGRDGDGYVSSTEPAKWSKDFRLMPLRYSLVNISSDTENDLRGAEGMIKKIIAGETLEDSYKHKDPIPFKTRSKLMMACNYFPTINDTSDGFMRRWIIVDLPMHFVSKDKVRPFTNDRELDPFLEDKLMRELPGIFNWVMVGLSRLLYQKGFTKTPQQDKLIQEFRAVNNPLYSFVEENEDSFSAGDEGRTIEKREVFLKFSVWAKQSDVLPMPSNRFYSNIRSVFNNLSMPFREAGQDWIFYCKEEE